MDLGRTHNLLDPLVVQTSRMTDSIMQDRVANVKKICNASVCEEFVTIQETKFLVPFHAFPLGAMTLSLVFSG